MLVVMDPTLLSTFILAKALVQWSRWTVIQMQAQQKISAD